MVWRVVVYDFYVNIVLSKDKNSKLWSTMQYSNRTSFKLNKNCMLFLSDLKSKQNHVKTQGGERERDSIYSVLVTSAIEKIEPPPFPPPTTPFPFINCHHRNSLKGYNLNSVWWGAEDFTLLDVVLEKAIFKAQAYKWGAFASGPRNWNFKRV